MLPKKKEASNENKSKPAVVGGVNSEQLKRYFDRIQRLQDDRQNISNDLKELYAEIKANGFDTKALRKCVAESRKDAAQAEKERQMCHLYSAALQLDLF